jgi:energy-coupling factor transporter ATP-binding protein EcfA2
LGFSEERVKRRIEGLVLQFGLKDLLDRHPAALSAGELQRTALAGALTANPGIALLDEPSSYLDWHGRRRLYDVVLSDEDMTVLAATQYPEETSRFDRVLLLSDASIAFSGERDELFTNSVWPRLREREPTRAKIRSSREIIMRRRGDSVSLSAADVGFAYDESREVIRKFNLDAVGGDTVAVVGNSGSGKTTMGLLLAGLEKPKYGKITHGSGDSDETRIGYLMQFPESQFFSDNVRDEVGFAIANQGLASDKIDEKVKLSLSEVGLDFASYADRSPFMLSGGEQRRIAVASTLIIDPQIIILDEPTVALDWNSSLQLQRLLVRLRRGGRLLVILSHEFDFLSRIATHFLLLSKGRICWSGSKFAEDLSLDLFREELGHLPDSLLQARVLHAQGRSLDSIEEELLKTATV